MSGAMHRHRSFMTAEAEYAEGISQGDGSGGSDLREVLSGTDPLIGGMPAQCLFQPYHQCGVLCLAIQSSDRANVLGQILNRGPCFIGTRCTRCTQTQTVVEQSCLERAFWGVPSQDVEATTSPYHRPHRPRGRVRRLQTTKSSIQTTRFGSEGVAIAFLTRRACLGRRILLLHVYIQRKGRSTNGTCPLWALTDR